MDGARAHSEIFAPDLLAGRVALVTGGGTGLGKATALELARCGASVTIAGRRGEVLREAAAEIDGLLAGAAVSSGYAPAGAGAGGGAVAGGGPGADGGPARPVETVVGDVRESADARAMIGSVLERSGRLDVLVNNAGGQFFSPAELIVGKGWSAVWRLNVEGMLNMAEAAVELALEPAGSGTIVNVTLSPHHGMPGMAHSGAARASVEALTRELARRWAGCGVAVSAVAVGVFDTEAMVKYPESVRRGMAHSVPLQRMGAVSEHAWLVTMLASPLGRAFSGSTVTLDGARDNWFGPWPPEGMADESGEVPVEERRRTVGGA